MKKLINKWNFWWARANLNLAYNDKVIQAKILGIYTFSFKLSLDRNYQENLDKLKKKYNIS